ncbi:hypothetical protein FSP39_012451, partial [Pinctada imbricata]
QNLEQYLKRRRASAVMVGGKDAIRTMREDSNLSLHQGRRSSVFSLEPHWEPKTAEAAIEREPGVRRVSRSNILDSSTLYSLKRENIAASDMGFRQKQLKANEDDVIVDIEQKIEREYIMKSRLLDNSTAKFEKAIIQHFFKAPAPKSHPGYGMPRPDTREKNPYRLMLQDLQRDPSMLQITSFPSLTNPVRCERENEFCEILGPCSCSTCIEITNRHIGDELQRIMFPQIDLTRERLVQPKLARVMKEGHLRQVRKRRLKELHLPDSFNLLKRKETHITNESAHFRRRRGKKYSSYTRSTKTPITPGMTLMTVKEEDSVVS